MRFVYSLQEPPTSDESDGPEPDSDSDASSSSRRVNGSSRRARKQRMSIVTNQLLSVPRDADAGCGWHPADAHGTAKTATAKRRFFQSAARWDDRLQRVLVSQEGLAVPVAGVAELMEAGGRSGEHDGSEPEEDMDVDEEEVEA